MGSTIPFRKRSTDVDNPVPLSDKKVDEGKDSVFKIVFKQVFIKHVNKPLQGMAPTECLQSACMLPFLTACLPTCLPACLLY